MRLLLDSHALIWAVDQPAMLGQQAALVLEDPANELLVSAATIWELSIKVGLGKISLSLPFSDWMNQAIADLGASVLAITVEHAHEQTLLPGRGDPFDRVAQDPGRLGTEVGDRPRALAHVLEQECH